MQGGASLFAHHAILINRDETDPGPQKPTEAIVNHACLEHRATLRTGRGIAACCEGGKHFYFI